MEGTDSRRVVVTGWVLAVILVIGVAIMVFNSLERDREDPTRSSASATTEAPECPPLVLSLPEIQQELRQGIIDHNVAMMGGGMPEDDFTRATRGLIEVSVRCWKFSLEDLKITPTDLEIIGMKP